jgi:hypothetical protein
MQQGLQQAQQNAQPLRGRSAHHRQQGCQRHRLILTCESAIARWSQSLRPGRSPPAV